MERSSRSWSSLSPRSRAAVVAAGVVQVGLQAAALIDLRRRPAKRVNGPKPLWVALSFVNTIGPISYFVVGRKR
jgi:hypothetical protein